MTNGALQQVESVQQMPRPQVVHRGDTRPDAVLCVHLHPALFL